MVGSGNFCAVPGCLNSWRKGKKEGKNYSFHSFPKRPQLRKQWIKFCSRKDRLNPNSARICSEHFTIDDYQLNFRMQLMGIPSKRMLIPDATPSRNPPNDSHRIILKDTNENDISMCDKTYTFNDILSQKEDLEAENKRQKDEIQDLKIIIQRKNEEIRLLQCQLSEEKNSEKFEKEFRLNLNVFSPNELKILKG